MQIILPHDHFDAAHLAAVKAEMVVLGAPTIKAVWMGVHGAWVAIEGSHRIRAAAELGMIPSIDEVEWSDTVTTDEVVPGSYSDNWTVEQVCDDAHTRECIVFGDAE
ncbi:hypothetical protein [Xanthomonas vasicola]|uniref:Uncharacterized protein n=2 Tax=Xanthomonas vasicola TaxID=56459 RepID=A0A836ZU49_XANVA|nr:hypothetical protein [Xanthomonas vasicola]KFA29358.1 hypothetical protein KW5_0107715 [Xanthomonas vasicola pv. vasculorum NCPPB 1326]MBV6748255.1 hypothetical protein [Xanthomonas vasicola pv. vasculorum NCPPB 890]MBV6893893.1 hypothetical protein [Xanthomonas vasicola pv. vasculorum]MDO6949537.1 hypothetical protein [Xanthomonas vasicola]MDO6961950.1 hypothetical protein [Xanthomonas vasicola]